MKQHYERVIALCCFLFLFTNIGLPSTSFSVYQPYIIATPGVGDVGGSLVLSVRTLTSLITVIFVDRYYHALDVRNGVFFACLMTAFGFLLYGFADSLALFILGALFAGAGYGLGGMVGMTLLISRWYDHDMGGAVGFATLGSGVASMIIPVVAVQVIEGQSLHMAFRLEALLALSLGIVVAVLLRNRPSDIGRANSANEGNGKETVNGDAAPKLATIPAVWQTLVLVAVTFVGCLCVGGGTYYSVLLTTQGFDAHFAATTLSIIGIALTASKFITGKMFDRFGVTRSSAIAFSVFIFGLACSCTTPLGSTALAVASGLAIGWGAAVGTVGVSIWSLQLADAGRSSKSVKNAQVAYSLGGFIMNAIPGPLATLTGTYVTTYAIMLCMCIFACVVIVSVYLRYRPGM